MLPLSASQEFHFIDSVCPSNSYTNRLAPWHKSYIDARPRFQINFSGPGCIENCLCRDLYDNWLLYGTITDLWNDPISRMEGHVVPFGSFLNQRGYDWSVPSIISGTMRASLFGYLLHWQNIIIIQIIIN